MDKNSLEQFLNESKGQKELSLILAKSDEEFVDFREFLITNDYLGSDDVFSVLPHLRTHKFYFVINDKSSKDIYDVALQYPTGQINLFNHNTMENIVINPDYKKNNIVLLTTSDYLNHISKQNLNFLSIVGMVYKS